MSGPSGRRKQKLRWSKLYTFSCLRPRTDDSAPTENLLGQPGFSRVVFCNEPQLHRSKPHKYPNNYVSTTKYNLITFLPRALFEQFRRVANLYFLLAAILSVTPLAAFNPVSVIAPLVFVIGISMLKEAIEDWHRFLQVEFLYLSDNFIMKLELHLMLNNRHVAGQKSELTEGESSCRKRLICAEIMGISVGGRCCQGYQERVFSQ